MLVTATIVLLVLPVSNTFNLNSPGQTLSVFSACQRYKSVIKSKCDCKHIPALLKCSEGNNEESDESVDKEDWRTFRARLVSGEAQNRETTVLFDGECDLEADSDCDKTDTSFLYESGLAIEQGTIILHRPPTVSLNEPTAIFGYGLGRQFLHKSVILIIEHSNEGHHVPTRGVILNRPTDLKLYDHPSEESTDKGDISLVPEVEWKVRYGGEDSGIHNDHPKFFCLHSFLPNAQTSSREVMNGIYFTSFQNAQELVRNDLAKSDDFWVFCGFISWENGELNEEIKDGIWHAISTDSHTVKKGLRILNAGDSADIEDSGVRTWSMLMNMLGKGSLLDSMSKGPTLFDDLMLKVWATRNLVFNEPPKFLRDKLKSGDRSTFKDEIIPGTIIRGSIKNAPFLLSDQEYHKSLILIVQNDDVSTGVILNRPSTRSFDMIFEDNRSFFQNEVDICFPLRFGGSYGGPIRVDVPGIIDQPMFFLHMKNELKEKNIGVPVGQNIPNGIWKCSVQEVSDTILSGMATAEDFLVIDGICIWSQEVYDDGSIGKFKTSQSQRQLSASE